MKYLKILIIPMIALMFFIPVKASDDVPYWVQGNYHYIIVEKSDGELMAFIMSNLNTGIFRTNSSGQAHYLPESLTTVKRKQPNGEWRNSQPSVSGTFDGVDYVMTAYVSNTVGSWRYKFSSFDIKNGSTLVFPKTPVMSLAMVQAKALETLETEVQGASGKILAVGGVILGAILVVHLISRSRLWVKV